MRQQRAERQGTKGCSIRGCRSDFHRCFTICAESDFPVCECDYDRSGAGGDVRVVIRI